jgi:transposase
MVAIVGQGTTLVAPNAQRKICGNNREGRMQAAMAKRKRHSRVEIATKLAQANDLATQGKLQSEIARTLGVSVMTLHRWRKAAPRPRSALVATVEGREPDRTRGADDRIAELQFENSRLRRLVTDLFLEKIKLEEAAQSQTSVAYERAFR